MLTKIFLFVSDPIFAARGPAASAVQAGLRKRTTGYVSYVSLYGSVHMIKIKIISIHKKRHITNHGENKQHTSDLKK